MKTKWQKLGGWVVVLSTLAILNGPMCLHAQDTTTGKMGNTGNTSTTGTTGNIGNNNANMQSSTSTTTTGSMGAMFGRQVDRIEKDLSSKLNLTSDQQTKVRDILNDLQKQVNDADQKIGDVLTPEQKTKYASLKENLWERHEHMTKGTKGTTGTRGMRRGTSGTDTTGSNK